MFSFNIVYNVKPYIGKLSYFIDGTYLSGISCIVAGMSTSVRTLITARELTLILSISLERHIICQLLLFLAFKRIPC